MKVTIFFSMLVLVLGMACTKVEKNQDHIIGRILFENPVSGEKVPAKKRIVLLKDIAQSQGFFLSSRTDSLGYYVFNIFDDVRDYKIFFEDTLGGLIYTDSSRVIRREKDKILSDTINLVAKLKYGQRIMRVIVKDSTNEALIKSASIYLYANRSFAEQHAFGFEYELLTTDSKGEALKTNASSDSIYLFALKKYPGNDTVYSNVKAVKLKDGLENIELKLKK